MQGANGHVGGAGGSWGRSSWMNVQMGGSLLDSCIPTFVGSSNVPSISAENEKLMIQKKKKKKKKRMY